MKNDLENDRDRISDSRDELIYFTFIISEGATLSTHDERLLKRMIGRARCGSGVPHPWLPLSQ